MTEIEKWGSYAARLVAKGKEYSNEYEEVIARLSQAWRSAGLCGGCGGQAMPSRVSKKPKKFCCADCNSKFYAARKRARRYALKPKISDAERRANYLPRFHAEVRDANREIFGYLGRQRTYSAARRQDHRCSTCDRLGAELAFQDGKIVYYCSICRRATA